MSAVSEKAMSFVRGTLEQRGMSVNALAQSMGESQATINRTIRGDVDVSFERLYNICTALEINIRDVIDHVERPSKKKRK